MKERLVALQIQKGWNDSQMADALGMARPTWNGIKNGHLRLTERHQFDAARAFPELLGELLTSVATSGQQTPSEAA